MLHGNQPQNKSDANFFKSVSYLFLFNLGFFLFSSKYKRQTLRTNQLQNRSAFGLFNVIFLYYFYLIYFFLFSLQNKEFTYMSCRNKSQNNSAMEFLKAISNIIFI